MSSKTDNRDVGFYEKIINWPAFIKFGYMDFQPGWRIPNNTEVAYGKSDIIYSDFLNFDDW